MNNAVIGLGFGDEGKGVTTEYLCSQSPSNSLVVRFSGGQQAGHKVVRGETEHIFSSLGSGTLSGCPTYWSRYCTFNPVGFVREFNILRGKGVDPKVYIHPKAMVTTPYDQFVCQAGQEMDHGTCGQGIYRTIKRTRDGLTLWFKDLINVAPEDLDAMLHLNRHYYHMEELDLEVFWNAVYDLRNLIGHSVFLSSAVPHYKNVVYEGSQGLMLDENIGVMPHCTPADVTPRKALELAGKLDEIYLVTRAYQTRHGHGPMTNEHLPVVPINNEKETNVTNIYQGRFRCTVLDLDQLMYAKREGIDKVVDSEVKVNLVVTCTDQMETLMLTHGDDTFGFQSPTEFAKRIAHWMEINGDVYINNSPESKLTRVGEAV